MKLKLEICHVKGGYEEMLRLLIRWVDGSKKGQKHADVILENCVECYKIIVKGTFLVRIH